MNRFSVLVLAALTLAASVSTSSAQTRRGVLIGTAAPGGVYYPLGGSICRLFNFTSERHGLRCATSFSDGSVDNIQDLRAGQIDVAIVQSDVLSDAIAGAGPFKDAGAWPALRVLMIAHDEPFTVVAGRGTNIASSADVFGKRVNIGPPGSGYRLKMDRLMAAEGLTRDSFAEMLELGAQEQVAALCAGRLDVLVYTVGHPNGLVQEATERCGGTIVPVRHDRIQTLLDRHHEYRRMSVPGSFYAGQAAAIETFGTNAIVITTETLSEFTAYELVKSVFEDFEEFKRLHPAFAQLTPQNSAQALPFATFHEGAARYFREHKLAR